jgi:hypothetical protein
MRRSTRILIGSLALILLAAGTALGTRNPASQQPQGPLAASQASKASEVALSDADSGPIPAESPATHPGPPVARFWLELTAAPADTQGFELYLRTDPEATAKVPRLCGRDATVACDIASSPFVQVIRDLKAGSVLVYRIQRVATEGSIEVITQGTVVVEQGMSEIRATYP